MTAPEITSLAREYAELTDGSPADIAYVTAIAENTIRFLLRRYCLVEKTKVKAIYRAKSEIYYCGFHNRDTVLKEGSQMELLESIFPEIAKEVEL